MAFLAQFGVSPVWRSRALLMVGELVPSSLEMEGSSVPWGHQGSIGDSWLSSPAGRLTWGLLEQVLQRPGMMGVLTSWRSRDIDRLFFPLTIVRNLVAGVLVTNIFSFIPEIQYYTLCRLTKVLVYSKEGNVNGKDNFRNKWLTRAPDRETVLRWYRDIFRQLQFTSAADTVVVILPVLFLPP